jgi:ribosomal protein L37E
MASRNTKDLTGKAPDCRNCGKPIYELDEDNDPHCIFCGYTEVLRAPLAYVRQRKSASKYTI